ncbi:MAG TPA: glucokinase [Methylococcus sp.]|nr:glucokinase [Methylococcus sp.]
MEERTRLTLLAGDVGGTKTVLGLYDCWGEKLVCLDQAVFSSQCHDGLAEIVSEFLAWRAERPVAACFGVAGPVEAGRSEITNLPWVLTEDGLSEATGIDRIRLLNDVQVMALGLLHLEEGEWVELNPAARRRPGNIAVIAAGTGLGEAILYWDGKRHHALPTEGGHCDFAPNTPLEDGLLTYLRERFGGHVSYERILSGTGLAHIYDYLRACGTAPESEELRAALSRVSDRAPVIRSWALKHNDPLCNETLALFARIFGAEAGNLALKCLALGGVFVGGGMAPRLLPVLRAGGFMNGFTYKGRFATLLKELSVRVAIHPQPALLGAAHAAMELI